MNTNQEDFIQQHAIEGQMTAQQAAQLLELGQGDTGLPEIDGAPDAIANSADDLAAASNADAGLNADNAVILAKDGKHTIPYDKLAEAREGEKHWKSQHAVAMQELEALRSEAQQRSDAGLAPTVSDNQSAAAVAAIEAGVNPEIFGDFSEEAIAKGVAQLVTRQVSTEVDRAVAQALKPIQQERQAQQQDAAATAHYQAIYDKHPDADSLVESKELGDWLAGKPSFERTAAEAVLGKGTAAEVVELFDAFKAATGNGQASPAAKQADLKAAARAAVARTQAAAPNSLSDIPGGTGVPLTRDEAMAQMNGLELSAAMETMTPAQIEAYLNRTV